MTEFQMMKNLLNNPNKETFCKKELSINAQRALSYHSGKRTINIKLPRFTYLTNNYIPREIMNKYYNISQSLPTWYEIFDIELKEEYQIGKPAHDLLPTIQIEVPVYEYNRNDVIAYLKRYIKEKNANIISTFMETYA